MQRVPLDDAGADVALQHGGSVGNTRRLHGGETRAHGFSPARVARHQMRLDQSRDDPEIAFEEEAVDQDRNSARGEPEVAVGLDVAGVVLHDPQAPGDLAAEHGVEFGRRVRSVQPGRDQDRHGLRREAAGAQRVQDRR